MNKHAFVLSGGGSRGAYEIGVWQALRETGYAIDIVTGTSVGALNGAMVAQDDFELAQELWKELETCMVFDFGPKKHTGFSFEIGGMDADEALDYAREILLHGGAGTTGLEKIVKEYVDEEKIRRSPIDLGVVTVEFPTFRPYYLFTEDIPQGKLHDYILASAACFPAVHAKKIDGVRFIDGGYADVLPVELAMKRGAELVTAVHLEAAGFVRRETMELAEEQLSRLLVIKSPWDLGNFLIFDTNNTQRILRLGYLDAMKELDVFSGSKYTFVKGEFTEHQLSGAEAAALIFQLDPCILYTKKTLRQHLALAISRTELPKPEGLHSPEAVLQALRRLGKGTLVLYIARNLREKQADSIFAGPALFKVLKEEILAANYLLQSSINL